MAQERRNLYRILCVQPEAPLEVVKASYRAIMTTLRAHPDRGGSHDAAVALNEAYAVLSDPQRRAAYDRSLRRAARPGRGTAAAPTASEPAFDPQRWQASRQCPFCSAPWKAPLNASSHCTHCNSPLTPAPGSEHAGLEILGRRRGQRFPRVQDVQLQLSAQSAPVMARVKDLSLTGVALISPQPAAAGSSIRVTAQGFEAIALVVKSRGASGGYAVHARLLTLNVLRSLSGTFVSMQA